MGRSRGSNPRTPRKQGRPGLLVQPADASRIHTPPEEDPWSDEDSDAAVDSDVPLDSSAHSESDSDPEADSADQFSDSEDDSRIPLLDPKPEENLPENECPKDQDPEDSEDYEEAPSRWQYLIDESAHPSLNPSMTEEDDPEHATEFVSAPINLERLIMFGLLISLDSVLFTI